MASFEERVALRLARLEAWCFDYGVDVSPCGEVDEPTACRLIHYPSSKALRRQASEGRLSDALRHGRRRVGVRWLYSLRAISEHIELEYDRWAVS